MKPDILKLMWVLLLFGLPRLTHAQFTFTTNNGAITITGYIGSDNVVAIPDTIDGYPVTEIGDDAFVSSDLTSLEISTNVTSIGISAFAFSGLTSVKIGRSVTSIGVAAFSDCRNLMLITVDTNNPAYSSVNGVLFDRNETTLIQYPTGNPAIAYTIPSSVTGIGYEAFSGCGNLAGITIPNSVSSIASYAFSLCGSLTNITIPNGVTSISEGMLNGCTRLTAITVATNNPVYSSVDGVLFDKNQTMLVQYPMGNSAKSYTIPNSVTDIGYEAFSECENLAGITIPTSVAIIGEYAFYGASVLASVSIPSSVDIIGDYAFYGCNNLTNLVISQGVVNIGAAAFFGSDLAAITIPSSVTNIGDYAFSYCPRLIDVYFQGNAPGADSTLFNGTSLATVYYLPGTSGWSSTFVNIPTMMLKPPNPYGSLQVNISPVGAVAAGAQWQVDGGIPQPSGAIVLGLSVGNHTVNYNTVNDWTSPTNYTVPVSAGLTAIAAGLYSQVEFSYATNSDNTVTIVGYHGQGGAVTVPATINGLPVTSIGEYAFESCYSITSVTIPNSVTTIQDDAFAQCLNLISVSIPNSVTSIGFFVFSDCYKMPSITIPSSVSYLGGGAFSDCTGLTNIYFLGNAPYVEVGVFSYDYRTTAYYLPGTTGWDGFVSNTYLQTVPWNPQAQTGDCSFGVLTNQFGFNITGTTNIPIVVEASTNPGGIWVPLQSLSLTNGSIYFSDLQWTNYPSRYYRISSP